MIEFPVEAPPEIATGRILAALNIGGHLDGQNRSQARTHGPRKVTWNNAILNYCDKFCDIFDNIAQQIKLPIVMNIAQSIVWLCQVVVITSTIRSWCYVLQQIM